MKKTQSVEKKKKMLYKLWRISYYELEKEYYGAYGYSKLSAMCVIMAQW